MFLENKVKWIALADARRMNYDEVIIILQLAAGNGNGKDQIR